MQIMIYLILRITVENDTMVHFQEVASKYLDNQLCWLRLLELCKNSSFEKRIEQMPISSRHKPCYTTFEMLRGAYEKTLIKGLGSMTIPLNPLSC